MNTSAAVDENPQGFAAIELVGVTKRYGDTTALDDLSIEIGSREFVVLLGPSGCGKSTVLKVIAGLEDATDGEVYIGGRLVNYVEPKQRDVAMVFQDYALYPHMTVAQNIGFPLKMGGQRRKQVAAQVAETARMLELETQLGKYPAQLSGGQRQRVALGRAIVRHPVAFLMDEPLSNLDAILRVQMRQELIDLHQRLGRTMLYVTHDQMEAMTMADRIVVLRDGVVQQVGTPRQIYTRPANTFVATFVGSTQMSLFEGKIDRGDKGPHFASSIRVPLTEEAATLPDGLKVTLGIRPEDVTLVAEGEPGALAGAVAHVEPVGADNYVRVSLPGDLTCEARVSAETSPAEGERVHVAFTAGKVHLFGQDELRLAAEPDHGAAPPALTPPGSKAYHD